ncbi:MAG: sulfite reductase flavoprotein subunit alpha, partial [Woeseiaceae bacterium]
MRSLPATPEAIPLDGQQTQMLDAALAGLSADQLRWISGYAAGLAAANGRAPVLAPVAEPGNALTVLYGSQTGNGEGVATELVNRVRAEGFDVSLQSLVDYKPSRLKREQLVAFVVSTHGEGDPPDDAELFHEFLMSKKAPQLADLKYTVLALGDSSYVNFCETGREFDARLTELGAKRLAPMVECDLDYEAAAAGWTESLVRELPDVIDAGTPVAQLRAVETVGAFDKHRPFEAEILVNQKITGGNSSKDVRHLELSLEGSGLQYAPGDALAVEVVNPPELVGQLLEELGFDGAETVQVRDESLPLAEALAEKLEITVLNLGFLRSWAAIAKSDELSAILESPIALASLIDDHQVIDVVRRFPARVSAQQFTNGLRKLTARSYSIASSLAANPDEVHLTVAAVRYEAHGSRHWGAASTFLADRVDEGDTVRVYIEPNTRFRLPADDDTPIIMIGPGTGVAPFRAFVEERAERNAKGASWLFFGDRTFADDFLYQLEWQRHLRHGRL